jgi:aminoglycoside 3-N-acetyltransferase I
MDYSLKRLTTRDLALMKELLAVYGKAFDDVETYTGAQPSDGYLQRLLDRRDFLTIVALQDQQVVGGLSAYVLEKFERERSEIYIYDLAVAEPHRRHGLATALIGELRRIGSAMGAYVIFVQADPGDTPAIALYTKLGVREDVHHFDIDVGPSS